MTLRCRQLLCPMFIRCFSHPFVLCSFRSPVHRIFLFFFFSFFVSPSLSLSLSYELFCFLIQFIHSPVSIAISWFFHLSSFPSIFFSSCPPPLSSSSSSSLNKVLILTFLLFSFLPSSYTADPKVRSFPFTFLSGFFSLPGSWPNSSKHTTST